MGTLASIRRLEALILIHKPAEPKSLDSSWFIGLWVTAIGRFSMRVIKTKTTVVQSMENRKTFQQGCFLDKWEK